MTDRSSIQRIHIGTKADVHSPGGLHGVIRGLSAAQASLGMDVSVIHNISSAKRYDVLRISPPAGGQDLPRPRSATAAAPLHEYHFAQTAALMQPVRAASDHRAVFHFHGPWSSESRVQGQSLIRVTAKFFVEWRAYRRFAAFTVHSEAFRQVLVNKFKIPEEKVALIYPGVDTTFFTSQNQIDARQALDLPADGFIVGSLRRLVPRMGLDLLLRAAADHPDAFVAIAGDGPERTRLTNLADELGMAHRVRLLGRLEQDMLPLFYSAIDCSIIPSRALEGFGLVALEALSCGTPVIASDVGGLPEALGPLADEWVFPSGDIARLSDLIGGVRDQSPSREALRRYAESRSWRECALEMETWFSTLKD